MRRSRSAFVLGLVGPVLALALVAGCSEDPEPKFAPTSPTATPSESASSSPTGPVEPTMPAAAKKHTAAGAKAFVRFWFGAFSFAMATGNSELVSSLSGSACTSCQALVSKIDDLYADGGHIVGTGWTVGRSALTASDDPTVQSLLLRVEQGRRTLRDGKGKVIDRTAATRVPMHALVRQTRDSWVMHTLEIIK